MTTSELATTSYVALTTYRKDGTAVTTPVWVAPFGDEQLAVITLADTWKVKRVRRDPRVQVQPCDVRGRVRPGAPVYAAHARLTETTDELREVRRAMDRKYLMARLGNAAEDLLGRLSLRKPRVGIIIDELRREVP